MTRSPQPPILTKDLLGSQPGFGASYKLATFSPGQVGFGVAVAFGDEQSFVDESRMAIAIPYASGQRRDGVGDLLEVEGIDFSRHVQNPAHLWNHQKDQLPLGMVQDPETGVYTGTIDAAKKLATDLVFFYRGKGLSGVDRTVEKDHALFCEQVFDLLVKKFLRSGSIGYQVIQAQPLPADPSTGTPTGYHLQRVLKLESSTVVLPANQDTVRKLLDLPAICGKAPAERLVKSLQPFAPERKAMANGIGAGEKKNVPVPLKDVPDTQIPHSKWKPGAGATCKAIREKYRKKAIRFGQFEVSNDDPGNLIWGEDADYWFVNDLNSKEREGPFRTQQEAERVARELQHAESMEDRSSAGGTRRYKMIGSKSIEEYFSESGNGSRRIVVENGIVTYSDSENSPVGQKPNKDFLRRAGWAKKKNPPTHYARDNEGRRYKILRTKYGKKGWRPGSPFFDKRDEADDVLAKRSVRPINSQGGVQTFANRHDKLTAYNVYTDFGIPVQSIDEVSLKIGGSKSMGTKGSQAGGPRTTRWENGNILELFGEQGNRDLRLQELKRQGHNVFLIDTEGKFGVRYEDKTPGRKSALVRVGQKSIRVNYRNRVVKGFAEVELDFDTSGMDHAKQMAFYKEMEAEGCGKPAGGRWSDGQEAKLLAPLKKACFKASLEPGKAVHEFLSKAAAVAAKHGAKWMGDNAVQKAVPQPTQATGTPNQSNGAKSMKVKNKKTARQQPHRKKDLDPAAEEQEAADEAVDTAEGAAAAEDVPVEDDFPVEKPGADALRKMHEHHRILLEDYHEALALQENPKVVKFVEDMLEDIAAKLDDIEALFGDEYPDADPLEDADEKDLDGGGDDDDSDVADSKEESVPPPEEVVEGMEEHDGTGEKRFTSTTRYRRKFLPKTDKKDAGGMCPACGADNGYEPTPDGIPGPDQNAGDSGIKYIKQLTQDDVGVIGGSSGFLKEAAEYQGDWGDDMRTKAGGWHKQLDPLGLAEANQAETPVPADPESEIGPANVVQKDPLPEELEAGMQTKAIHAKQAADIAALTKTIDTLTKVVLNGSR